MECLFCNIANGKTETDLVYQDDEVVAFPDIKPKAPVHLLIVPKKHLESLNEVSDQDKELIWKMILVAKKLAKDFGVENGYKLKINTGRKSGQEIDHLHMHLLGYTENTDKAQQE
jgi:histidine triad (HIT) family protein